MINITNNITNKSFVLVMILALLTPVVSAVSLSGIEVNPDDISLDDTFEVEVSFRGDTCGTEVKFFIGDDLFSSKIVGCERDSICSSEWDLHDKPLECGRYIFRVDLIDDGEIIDNISMEISIGNRPLITLPERPLANKEFKIHFEDSDTGKAVDDLKVKIYNVLMGSDEIKKYHTNSNGDIMFKSGNPSEFKLIIDDSKYCGSRNFQIKKTLSIDGPYPAEPMVGELITIAVPTAVGVKVLTGSGNVYTIGSTNIGGGVNLTINDPGNYSLVVGELSRIYWGENISIYVSDRLKPTITITPDVAIRGRVLTIDVNANGRPVGHTAVTLQKPSGTEEHNTDENGKLKFTPPSTGQFLVKVETARYLTCEKTFEVRDLFNVESLVENPGTGEDITLFVRDQLNNMVQGATISVRDIVHEISSPDGSSTFRLGEPGKYTVTVTKPDFWDFTCEITVLSQLHLELGPTGIELGETITPKVFVLGSEISANIEVTKPNGEKESPGGDYTPKTVGIYNIIASKEGYISANKSIVVGPRPLRMDSRLMGDLLLVNVTSHGKPVSGIGLVIEKPTGTDELVTDNEGGVEIRIKDGMIKISANVINTNPNYGKILVNRNVVKRHDFSILVLAVSAVVLLAVAAIVVVHVVPGKDGQGAIGGGQEKGKKNQGLERGKGSKLSNM